MLTYADACSRMLAYADVCGRMYIERTCGGDHRNDEMSTEAKLWSVICGGARRQSDLEVLALLALLVAVVGLQLCCCRAWKASGLKLLVHEALSY